MIVKLNFEKSHRQNYIIEKYNGPEENVQGVANR
jgi:hypothetical protein